MSSSSGLRTSGLDSQVLEHATVPEDGHSWSRLEDVRAGQH